MSDHNLSIDEQELQDPLSYLYPPLNGVVDQCKSLVKNKSSPVKVTLLCDYPEEHYLSAIFAEQLSRFPQIKVTVLGPASHPLDWHYSWLKERSQRYGYRLVEAKKQRGFHNPHDWLMFPPEGLKTDIVVGVGRRLGGIAQLWKERYQCNSVCVEDPYECFFNFNWHSECELAPQREADLSIAIGPKMHDQLSRELVFYNNKPVFNFTPGTVRDFSDVPHGDVNATEKMFLVLMVVSDDPNCFEKEGCDIAAKAVAQNGKPYRLICVGAGRKRNQLAKKFLQCGVAKAQLDFQSLPRGMEDWKILLSRVDLAIMPSGQKEFGLEALFALSAGLPVLVHADSGFGEALKVVTFGTSAIVDSDDAAEWAEKIRKVRETEKKTRLEQATKLRACYDEKYSWEKQCRELVKKMVEMVSAKQDPQKVNLSSACF